jgi:hypothetical protein
MMRQQNRLGESTVILTVAYIFLFKTKTKCSDYKGLTTLTYHTEVCIYKKATAK